MVTRPLLIALLPLLLNVSLPAAPDEREVGLPFLRAYLPREYGAQANNWAVVQDPRGVIYLGNNDGVLVYDGVRWRTIRVPNRSAVRSLALDARGTVYVGARGTFGYLSPDATGTLQYVSLLERTPPAERDFKDVRSTIATADGIFFCADERLFRWRPETGVTVWRPKGRFHSAFLAGNELYVHQPGDGGGLLRLNGDLLSLVPGGERFAKDRIYCISSNGPSLLVGAATGGMFLYKAGSFQAFPSEADALLRESQPYSCNDLPGGVLAIATARGGVVLLGRDGKLIRHLDMKSGLASDAVAFALPDKEGGLWLALNSGIARVQTPSPLSFFDERTGLKGSVLALARNGDSLYAGTSAGLFQLEPTQTGEFARFRAVTGIEDRVRALLSTETGLLIGASDGVYELRAGQFRPVRNKGGAVYRLTRSRRDPALVYASGRSGLALIRMQNGAWTDGGKVRAVDRALRNVVETPSGLWLGTDFEGALRVDGSLDSPVVSAFGLKDGLPPGWVYPSLAGGRIVFLTENGILKYDATTRHFDPDPLLAPMFADSSDKPSILVEDQRGNLWVGAKTYGGVLRRQPDGTYKWDTAPLRRMTISEIEAAHVDQDGTAWAGTAEGIVRYNQAIPKDYGTKFAALVRRVSGNDGHLVYFGGSGTGAKPNLRFTNNSLRFEFAAPSFEDAARTEYRVYLDGFDRNWSPWTQETQRDYTNLPEGDYSFRVEARNLYGTRSEQAAYSLAILPPWYRSWWGYALQLLGIALLLWLLIRWRLRLLADQNRRLQQTVDERTAELRENFVKLSEANGKLIEVNGTLNQLNEEKNEFMGIAAHDLKNPLGAIRGYVEMLEEDIEDISKDEIVDVASRIKKSANLMFNLVSNLLDVNRIEEGKIDLTLIPCDLAETVRQAVDGYRQRAQAKQIAIHFEDQANLPLVRADAVQLVQVIDNLVSNAVKYSPSGKNIYARVRAVNGGVRAEVRDEGPGISAEDQKRLFLKFARLTARPTGGEHSTGLGLAIVRRLVESMKGRVWCESDLGKGATFIVEFPLALEAQHDDAVAGAARL